MFVGEDWAVDLMCEEGCSCLCLAREGCGRIVLVLEGWSCSLYLTLFVWVFVFVSVSSCGAVVSDFEG